MALHSPTTSPPFHTISIAAGAGGLDLALKIAEPNARCVCYIEREAYAAATLVARMEDAALDCAPVWDDITTFDGRPWRGRVHCITAGFPCQPVSVAGKQKAQSDERWLWDDVARIINEVEPEWVFIENVRNLINLGFELVWRDLRRLGYTIEAGIFSAAEVGASHKRERLFILANAGGQRRQQITGGTHGHESPHEGRGTPDDYQPECHDKDVANPQCTERGAGQPEGHQPDGHDAGRPEKTDRPGKRRKTLANANNQRPQRGGGSAVTRKDGKSRMSMLDWKAENWHTPRANDAEKRGTPSGDHRNGLPGQSLSFPQDPTTSIDGRKSSNKRRSLSPLFVEWLMGWPLNWTRIEGGWTDCDSPVMALSPWLAHMRGALSKLATCEQAEQINNERQTSFLEMM